LVVNIGAVVYLVLSKRLFGARGGAEAYEAERRGESLWEVEESAGALPVEDDAEQQRAQGGERADRAPDGEAGAGAGPLVQERADP